MVKIGLLAKLSVTSCQNARGYWDGLLEDTPYTSVIGKSPKTYIKSDIMAEVHDKMT
jgi:hypothetical protein